MHLKQRPVQFYHTHHIIIFLETATESLADSQTLGDSADLSEDEGVKPSHTDLSDIKDAKENVDKSR